MADLTSNEGTLVSENRPWAAAVEQLNRTIPAYFKHRVADGAGSRGLGSLGLTPSEDARAGQRYEEIRLGLHGMVHFAGEPEQREGLYDKAVQEVEEFQENSPERLAAAYGAIDAMLAIEELELLPKVDRLLEMSTGVTEWRPFVADRVIETLTKLKPVNPGILSRPEVVSILLKLKSEQHLNSHTMMLVDNMLNASGQQE